MLNSLKLGRAVMGLALEQGHLMTRLLNATAFNGGVQVLDLPRMRNSIEYVDELENIADNRRDFKGLSKYGDQTIYSLIVKRYPHLVKTLGCEWNRQAGSWRFDNNHFRRLTCDDCAMLHVNDPNIKFKLKNENSDFNLTNIKRLLRQEKRSLVSVSPCLNQKS